MNLFSDLKIPSDQLSENYKRILHESYSGVRKVINYWANDFIDRDKKFVKEFQTTFNSSFWELYCYAVIKELGWDVDFSYYAPDFVIKENESCKVAIECTITNPPKGGLEESNISEKLDYTMDIDTSVDLSTIRLSNSINSKLKWFRNNESKIDILDKPFILAIAPFDQPNWY